MNSAPLSRLQRSALIGIYKHFDDAKNTNGQFTEGQIGDLRRFGVNPGVARAALQGLVDSDLLQRGADNDQNEKWVYWEFTALGADVVYQLILDYDETENSLAKKLDQLQGSEFTDLSQFSEQLSELRGQVDAIETYLQTNNELNLTSEERGAALAEVRGFQAVILSNSARTTVLANAISHNGIFRFLKDKVPDKTIGAIVSAIITGVAKWLGF